MTRTFPKASVTGIALAALIGIAPAAAQQSGQGGTSGGTAQQDAIQQAVPPDTVIATVGGTDIVGADLIAFLDTLPPQMRQQPPEMLLSMGAEQLVLRELFLQEARSRNLAEDPRVTAIIEEAGRTLEEDALVAVYLEDQLDARVTEEAVQQTYEQIQSEVPGGEALPLEEVRPQIEQQLRQEALLSIREDLTEGADVVFYGAGGVPINEGASGSPKGASGADGGGASDGSSQDSSSQGSNMSQSE